MFIHVSVDEHLSSFHFLAFINNAAVKSHVQVFMWMYVFISVVCVPSSGNGGSYGNFMCNLLRNGQNVVYSSCAILHSHRLCISVLGFHFLHMVTSMLFSGDQLLCFVFNDRSLESSVEDDQK